MWQSELVRVRAREPALPSVDRLPEPWSLVVADVAAQRAHHRDDTITSRTVLWLPSAEDTGTLRLTFAWGLLQEAVIDGPHPRERAG